MQALRFVFGPGFIAGVAASIVLSVIFTAFAVQERQIYFDRAVERVMNESEMLMNTSVLILTEVDQTLQLVATMASQAGDEDNLADTLFNALGIARQTTDLPNSIFALDAEGRILVSSTNRNPESYPLGDVDYVSAHLEGRTDGLFIGAARIGRLGTNVGKWIIGVSRAIRADDGTLLAVIAATLSVEKLETILYAPDSHGQAVGGWVSDDGSLLFRSPFAANAILDQTAENKEQNAQIIAQADRGAREQRSYTDGNIRLVAWQSADDFPITATAAYETSDLMFEWSRSLSSILVVAIGSCVLLISGGFLVDRFRAYRAFETQRADQRFEMLLNSIDDLFLAADGSLRITEANTAARAVLGDGDLKTSSSLYDVFPELGEDQGQHALQRALEQGQRSRVQVTRAATGEVYSIHIYPFFEGVAVMAESITERMSIEARLHQSQKMEALGQLTGGIAHDFNNLLTVIIGNAEAVLDYDIPSDIRQNTDEILHASEQAAELISQLLAFARQQPLMPRSVDLNTNIRNLDPMFRRVLPEGITIDLDLDPQDWRVWVDPNQLEAALLNIVINARDAITDSGNISIETRKVVVDRHDAMPGLDLKLGQFVKLSISDTGQGMSREIAGRAFDPFFSTKPEGEGTGLGLSMVYGFARQSGGQASIYSEPGMGTTISLYLPRSLEDFSEADGQIHGAVETDELPRGVEKVLIVEDNPMVRQFAKSCLVHLGYNVTDLTDAPEALELFASGCQFDLILSDVVLPGKINGPAMAETLWQQGHRFALLFMSGYPKSALKDRASWPDAEILGKPFKRATLAHAVRAALSRHQLVNGGGG